MLVYRNGKLRLGVVRETLTIRLGLKIIEDKSLFIEHWTMETITSGKVTKGDLLNEMLKLAKPNALYNLNGQKSVCLTPKGQV